MQLKEMEKSSLVYFELLTWGKQNNCYLDKFGFNKIEGDYLVETIAQ